MTAEREPGDRPGAAAFTGGARDEVTAGILFRARSAYRDPNWPERTCDHCGGLHRGPAVYCCFECALADE